MANKQTQPIANTTCSYLPTCRSTPSNDTIAYCDSELAYAHAHAHLHTDLQVLTHMQALHVWTLAYHMQFHDNLGAFAHALMGIFMVSTYGLRLAGCHAIAMHASEGALCQ